MFARSWRSCSCCSTAWRSVGARTMKATRTTTNRPRPRRVIVGLATSSAGSPRAARAAGAAGEVRVEPEGRAGLGGRRGPAAGRPGATARRCRAPGEAGRPVGRRAVMAPSSLTGAVRPGNATRVTARHRRGAGPSAGDAEASGRGAREGRAAGVDTGLVELLLDAQQLVVLVDALAAGGGAGLDL